MIQEQINALVERALREDIGNGDVTTRAIVSSEANVTGHLVVNEPGVVAGIEVAAMTYAAVDERIRFAPSLNDGDHAVSGTSVGTVAGPASGILAAERVALNFMQRMSGIATMTRKFVDAASGMKAVILDTRKTAPGLRLLDKWAVRLGGAQNHRMGLFDMALVKENHIAVAGGIAEAVRRVRKTNDRDFLVEVEVRNLDELKEALGLKVDRILLDNMSLEALREAVRIAGGRVSLEASGKVTLKNVGEIAATGVDFISVGALTHSVQALDISFLVEPLA
jgi:nicotinate-nucleotide pyrophosphorylase (carboxylating)